MSRFHRNTLILGLAVLLALPFVAPTPATAGTERYTSITSIPYTINTPGGYKLVGNQSHTSWYGVPITINCDNVTLDLDGYTIVNSLSMSYSGPNPAIKAVGRSNIKIRNGTLRSFVYGIQLTGDGSTPGIVVEDITLIGTSLAGVTIENANGAIVRRCNVIETGVASQPAVGLKLSGKNGLVQDNVITKMKAGSSIAIDVSESAYAVVERNRIANEYPDFYLPSIGIKFGGPHGIAIGNRICHYGTGIVMGPASFYRDNFADPVGAKYVGGTDAGNNY